MGRFGGGWDLDRCGLGFTGLGFAGASGLYPGRASRRRGPSVSSLPLDRLPFLSVFRFVEDFLL